MDEPLRRAMVEQSRLGRLIRMKDSAVRDAFIAAIATIAALAPFLSKAFHIDDPLFLWIGQQISRHPENPYGFAINWYVTTQPMSSIMQNPPLSSYYMALVANVIGWSETAMHGAFLFPAVAAVLGTLFLARRFCSAPLPAALLLLFTPVFLVSATGVMCDVWLLAFWVWSIECWILGLEEGADWLLLLAAILASAAALTKYFGITLVPLLFVYTLTRQRKLSGRLLYLFIPVAIVAGYEAVTQAKYGHGLFSSAMLYSWKQAARPQRHLLQQLLIGLSFAGGCLFSVLFYAPLLVWQKRVRHTASPRAVLEGANNRLKGPFRILFIGLAIFAIFLAFAFYDLAGTTASRLVRGGLAVEEAVFITVGIAILALVLRDVLQQKTADSLLLGLWVLGTLLFAALMNWSITGRTFLPMAPAAIILMIRGLEVPSDLAGVVTAGRVSPVLPLSTAAAAWRPILPAALVSLLITVGDYKLANTARVASNYFQNRFRNELGTVWFEGHWGFQYYMQKWNAKPMDKASSTMLSGDVLIVPINNTNVLPPAPGSVIPLPLQINFSQFPVTTMSSQLHTGFYSSLWGSLPWAIAPVPPERYLVYRTK